MPPLNLDILSLQMRLEGLNSFALPQSADDRGAQEQLLRCFSSPTHVSPFVLGTTLHVLRFWSCTLPCKAFFGALATHRNNSFSMWSTTDSTIPKMDMSQIMRTLLLSLAARLVRTKAGAATWFRRHYRSVCIAVRIRACMTAHAPNHTHGASCVDFDDTLLH